MTGPRITREGEKVYLVASSGVRQELSMRQLIDLNKDIAYAIEGLIMRLRPGDHSG
ncbi:MAG: hypothetical protein JKY99_12245 [Rhizobiales bacterium]|nr:hypothetical protein [Hyphomicrobiales bacterium]